MVFLTALQSMVSITLLCVIGYVLAWKGWFARETEIFIPRFIMNVVLPPYLVESVVSHFKREELLQLVTGLVVPAVSILATFFIFLILAKLLRVSKKRAGLIPVCAAFSNTLFIGIPVNQSLFGLEAVPCVLLYYLANSSLFWFIGNYFVADAGDSSSEPLGIRRICRQIFSPPLCAMLLGVFLVITGIPLPKVLGDTCRYIGGITTPLALIFVGCTLRRIDWGTVKVGKDLVIALIGRILICPLITFSCLPLASLADLTQRVFVMQGSLPGMANLAVVAAYYGADKQFCSVFVSVSTLLGLVTVPIWMTIVCSFI